MRISRIHASTCLGLGLCAALAGCPSAESDKTRNKAAPQPRAEDPPLTHTWKIPPETSRVTRGDMGSNPEPVGDALMQTGTLPGLVHEVGKACEDKGALPKAGAELVIRIVTSDGKLATVQGDPQNPTTKCFESEIQAREAKFAEVPDGLALVRLELSAPPS